MANNFDGTTTAIDNGFSTQNIKSKTDINTNPVKSPEWMVKIDDLMSSTIGGFEAYGELYSWGASHARISKGETGNNFLSTSAMVHSAVELTLVNNVYAATLDIKMATGANIGEITIVRLTNVGDLKKTAQQVKFTNCKVEKIDHVGDYITLSFRPETRENTIYQYDQTGANKGQAVSLIDYTTGSATAS